MKTFGDRLLKSILISLCCWLTPAPGFSQCSGGLGAPIFKETFGTGTATYAPRLPGGTTNYVYTAGCPDSSQYTIVNSLSGCPGWHTLTDHTGDPGGYFMAVAADLLPVTVYTHTISGLCPGSSYELSAWLTNLDANNGSFLPIVYFFVEKPDGTLIARGSTYPLPVTNPNAQWIKFALDFSLPADVSNVVILIDNDYWRPPLPVHGGNNFAIDDITFGPAGPSAKIGVNGFAGDTVKVTCNQSTLISSVGNCYAKNEYQWQISSDGVTWADIPGATASNYSLDTTASGTWFYQLLVAQTGNIGSVNCRIISNTLMVIKPNFVPPKLQSLTTAICSGAYTLPSGKQVNTSGVYIDTALNSQGCDSLISTVNLSVAKKPDLGQNRVICPGDTIVLNPGAFNTYKWQNGSTNPSYTVTSGGTYSVTVTDSAGCVTTGAVQIREGFCGAHPIPNAFTPNGDGINDTWNIPQLLYYPTCTVFIYNRWGGLVFSSTGYATPWDGTYGGKPAPGGTYYYIITLQTGGVVFSGFVTVIR